MSELRTAFSKSAVAWVVIEGRTWPIWYLWTEPTAYVITGPGEQTLPELPEQVQLVVRAKDTRAAVGRVPARVRRMSPRDPDWDTVTAQLTTARLNCAADAPERWAELCVLWAVEPDFESPAPPATADEPSGAQPPWPSAATTDSWRPQHRPARRRRR